jgi:hypothetical protein
VCQEPSRGGRVSERATYTASNSESRRSEHSHSLSM